MTSIPTDTAVPVQNDHQTLAELYTLLAKCFEHPSEPFSEAVRTGQFDTEVRTRLDRLDVDADPVPTVAASHGELREGYLRTFEGFEGPSAPPIESVYEPWWDGRERRLLSGPAEADAKRRYGAIEAEIPNRYPADHLAVLLEYAALTLEAGRGDEYADFHAHHFDWLDAFTERVRETSAAPFYRWAAETTARVAAEASDRFIDDTDSGGDSR